MKYSFKCSLIGNVLSFYREKIVIIHHLLLVLVACDRNAMANIYWLDREQINRCFNHIMGKHPLKFTCISPPRFITTCVPFSTEIPASYDRSAFSPPSFSGNNSSAWKKFAFRCNQFSFASRIERQLKRSRGRQKQKLTRSNFILSDLCSFLFFFFSFLRNFIVIFFLMLLIDAIGFNISFVVFLF